MVSLFAGMNSFIRSVKRKDRARQLSGGTRRCHLVVERLEERCVPSTGIQEFGGLTASSAPLNITLGPDGNLWFTEQFANKIGRLNPASNTVTEFDVPTPGSGPQGITVGPDGNLWFTEEFTNKIGRITTAGVITAADEFPIPTAASGVSDITPGLNDDLWFTEHNANKIGHITTAGVITAADEFPIPTANSGPSGITVLPGRFGSSEVWFTETGASQIGRLSTLLGADFHEFATPTSNSEPDSITVGPDGNLWFTEGGANKIGRITTAGVITAADEFSIPMTAGVLRSITAGPDGNLWFTRDIFPINQIGAITTAGRFIAEFIVPTSAAGSRGITAGPHSSVAFTEAAGNKIGLVHDVLDANHAFVQGLYHDALGRMAMPAELDFWVSVLVQSGSAAVVNGIEHSLEGRTHLVKSWYLQYLGRPAMDGEEQGLVQLLAGGATEEQVLSLILGSPEYFHHAPLLPGNGGGASSDQAFIKALYLQLLNRPARDSEVNAWVSAIAGLGRGSVAQLILGSAEHRSVMVGAYYTSLLHRDMAAPAEVAGWVNSGMDLGRIRLTFESTLEFYVNG